MRSSSSSLGGSISAKTVHALLALPHENLDQITSKMTFANGDPYTFDKFLEKFHILEQVNWDERALGYVLGQVCWDMAKECLDYVELKFSVDKYKFATPAEIIRFIYDRVEAGTSKWGIRVALVLSLKYEADRELQRRVAKVISDPKVVDLLGGIDIVGNEAFFERDFYQPIMREWKEAGKGLQMHVGETQSAKNVRTALELGIDRIAHGIRAVDDPDLLSFIKERDVCFDIALTSNIMTGVVKDIGSHPVGRILEAGCAVTIGTDDPYILQTTLDKEYELLRKHFNVGDEQLMDIMHNSIKYAFADLTA